jgi:CPA2 family monovalent cation:H+ antiporter-2
LTERPADAALPEGLIVGLGLTLSKVVAFVLLMLLVGARLLPWLLERVARTGS